MNIYQMCERLKEEGKTCLYVTSIKDLGLTCEEVMRNAEIISDFGLSVCIGAEKIDVKDES